MIPLTSLFRELVSLPTIPCFSIKTTFAPSTICNLRATAKPTTPAPITACVKSALEAFVVENSRDLGCFFRTRCRVVVEAGIPDSGEALAALDVACTQQRNIDGVFIF